MLTRINETRTSTKHVSYKCECKFDGRTQIKNGITINVVESVKIQKNIMSAKRYIYLEFCYMKLRKWSIFRKYY